MLSLRALGVAVLLAGAVLGAAGPAGEYAGHFDALARLSVAVAEAMPADQYDFRPHPDSMTFGELMSHIAATNYQFCDALKDVDTSSLPQPAGKEAVVKFLRDSFEHCSPIVASLADEQLRATHSTPDGLLTGRETLLAMYIHVAHHRGQAEIYLRDKGIKPPRYRI